MEINGIGQVSTLVPTSQPQPDGGQQAAETTQGTETTTNQTEVLPTNSNDSDASKSGGTSGSNLDVLV